jgi:hypothetical protein
MTCGCGGTSSGCFCDERVPQTPLPVDNQPGQSAIRRRVATHATAKASILRALSDPRLVALASFTRRDDDDFSVALADAAAVVADILTFYTERFVNEHYIRTSAERRSVVELARLLGYQVQPGLAPTADLSFTMDPSPGAPAESVIAAGTGVQSSPDPGQLPVIYETLADVVAKPSWNAIRPRPREPHPTQPGTTLSFAGVVTVSVGDGVLYRTGDSTAPVAFGTVSSVSSVDAVPDLPGKPGSPGRTDVMVALIESVAAAPPDDLLPALASAGSVPASVSWLAGQVITAEDLDTELLARSQTLADIAGPFAHTGATAAQALLFRQQRALFGSQAPLSSSVAATAALEAGPQSSVPREVQEWAKSLVLPWESATAASAGQETGDVYLDGATPAVPVGSLLVLRDGTYWGGYLVTEAESISIATDGISGRATRVHLDSTVQLGQFSIRRTSAYAGPVPVSLADVPAPETLDETTIELDGLMVGLRKGRPVVIVGEPAADRGHPITVPTTLDKVVHDFGPAQSTTITLADHTPSGLARSTTAICANVAPASQGETRREVLGSGDARHVFQSFVLRQSPLTYLSVDNPSGMQSTLSIWVDEVQWAAVDSFQDAGPGDHVYVVRDQDGQTVVQFGDGTTGARLPTGVANVRAVYRTGGDLAGGVRAGQLSLPMSRSGGVTGVTNPAASVGGDDPEPIDSGRVSAPLRVTTIDRVVSLADYALFARAFPGVAKAQAVWARAAGHRGVLITVAGHNGAVLDSSSGIGKYLLAAIQQAGDPLVPAALLPYVHTPFRLAANVRTDPDRVRTDVLAAVSARLSQAFSFEARDLGQSVSTSEVLAEIQGVAGVVAATITAFWKLYPGRRNIELVRLVTDPLTANAPLPGADIGTLTGAELLTLDAAPISWGVLP